MYVCMYKFLHVLTFFPYIEHTTKVHIMEGWFLHCLLLHCMFCYYYSNKSMVEITEQYIFTRPFQDGDPTNKHDPLLDSTVKELRGNAVACQRSEEMKKLFTSCKESLCHGDLHTGSVMVNKDNQAKVNKTPPLLSHHNY